MSKGKILIVEDEAYIAEVLEAYCHQGGYETHWLTSGGTVMPYLAEHTVDLVLLDLMLPEVDGISLCKQIRKGSDLPIIMVTAKSEEVDRLRGLELGADDYICKPFSPREVVARINTVLRRVPNKTTNELEAAGFRLLLDEYLAYYNGKMLDLTPYEFRIVETLARQVNRVFSREQLIEAVYTNTDNALDRNIDSHMRNIRKKIRKVDEEFSAIESVYGVGYRLFSER